MSVQTAFETKLYFHALSQYTNRVEEAESYGSCDDRYACRNGCPASAEARDALTEVFSLGPMRIMIQRYMWFNQVFMQFQI